MSTPSTLAQLVADVMEELEARNVHAPHALGRKHVERHGPTTRFVWVPKGGTGGPAIRTEQHPRSLATRHLNVEIWIFADEYAQAENLLAQLHVAIRSMAMGSSELKGESAPTGDAHQLTKGEVLIATYQFQLPIEDRPPTTVKLTDAAVIPEDI